MWLTMSCIVECDVYRVETVNVAFSGGYKIYTEMTTVKLGNIQWRTEGGFKLPPEIPKF